MQEKATPAKVHLVGKELSRGSSFLFVAGQHRGGTMMLGAFRATLSEAAAVPFISGVCSASGAWFFLLTLLVYACKSRLNGRILRALNVVCGIIIIFYGLKLLGNFVAML